MAFKMFTGDSKITKALPYGDKSVQQYNIDSGALVNPKPVNPAPVVADTKNAFAHKPDNITPAASSNKIEFQTNILDNYDVVTYHWKLYMTSLENSASGNVLNLENQIIIAESGVSDLTIDKIDFNAIVVPSVENGTGTQTTLKFEIVEPGGASLFDKMFYKSISLGIGSWPVQPFYLQLEFRGRDPDTSNPDLSGAPGAIGNLKWVWPIKLTGSKANVTTVGTRYECDAIVYDELAQSNSYFSLQHNVTLKGLTNFQEAMANLEKKLNADQLEKLIDNYGVPDTYRIVIDPVFYGAAGMITPYKQNDSTSRGSDFINFTEKTAIFPTGTSIDKIIDSLLGNTEYYQTKLPSAPAPNAPPNTINTEPHQMKKLWRITTETHPIEFDPIRSNNAVAITVFVIEYDIGLVDVNPSQLGQTPDTKQAAKKRITEYSQKRILNKIYNYIFTGLNTQVIAFDLTMNHAYAATQSRFGGIYSNTATQTGEGVTNQKHAEEEKNFTTQLRKTVQFINNATPEQGKQVEEKISEMKSFLKNSEASADQQKQTDFILGHAKSIHSNGTVARPNNSAAQNAKLTAENTNAIPEFISDVKLSSQAIDQARQTALAIGKGKMRPVAFTEGVQESNITGIDQSSNSGRNRVSSIFATALYSTLDPSFQQVKLTVKGDPYWLFPNPIPSGQTALVYNSEVSKNNPAAAIESIKNSHYSKKTSVNVYGTDNFVVIRFRSPKIYSETTGIIEPYTDSEMFSGIYRVTMITSNFAGGKFTQELTCMLDPVIDITDLKGFLTEIEVSQGLRSNESGVEARNDFAKTDERRTDVKNVDRVVNTPGRVVGPVLPSRQGQ